MHAKLWLQVVQPLTDVHETKWTPHVKRESDIAQQYNSSDFSTRITWPICNWTMRHVSGLRLLNILMPFCVEERCVTWVACDCWTSWCRSELMSECICSAASQLSASLLRGLWITWEKTNQNKGEGRGGDRIKECQEIKERECRQHDQWR